MHFPGTILDIVKKKTRRKIKRANGCETTASGIEDV